MITEDLKSPWKRNNFSSDFIRYVDAFACETGSRSDIVLKYLTDLHNSQ